MGAIHYKALTKTCFNPPGARAAVGECEPRKLTGVDYIWWRTAACEEADEVPRGGEGYIQQGIPRPGPHRPTT